MKLCMFRTVRLSIIRGLFTVHSAMVYVVQVCRQLSSRTRMFHSGPARKAVYKTVWHMPLLSVQWINPWLWTDELSETCRVSWQNKFVILVRLVGFIIKKQCEVFWCVQKDMLLLNVAAHWLQILVQLTNYAVFILLLSYSCGLSSSRECIVVSSLVSPSLMKSFESCIKLSTSTHFVCFIMKMGNVCQCCTGTLNMHADGETWISTEVKEDKTRHSPF